VLATQPGLDAAIKNEDAWLQAKGFPLVSIVRGMTFVLMELPSLEPHLAAVRIPNKKIEGTKLDVGWETVILASMYYVRLSESTTVDESGATVHNVALRTRMIEDDIGEDPATGSASCALACYLALQNGAPSGKFVFDLTQGVEMGRQSDIRIDVRLNGDGKAIENVQLSGQSSVVMQGTLTL